MLGSNANGVIMLPMVTETFPQPELRAIWSEVLQRIDLSGDADFFQLGGDSLQMMIMLFRVNEAFSLDLTPDVVFENPTLGQFSEHISKILANSFQNTQEGTI